LGRGGEKEAVTKRFEERGCEGGVKKSMARKFGSEKCFKKSGWEYLNSMPFCARAEWAKGGAEVQ